MISIVVPLYNEEESLPFFNKELQSYLLGKKDYEIIFVDDGSTDRSFAQLKEFEKLKK